MDPGSSSPALPKSEHPFLSRQVEEFSGLDACGFSVTNNTPITSSIVPKLMPFLKNHIRLYVSPYSFMGYRPEVVQTLVSAGAIFHEDKNSTAKGDVFLDCGAELLDRGQPKAIAELTQTGARKYESTSLPIPVISIDHSRVKLLEDYFGTSDGFMRAFAEKVSPHITGKHFVIVGYGKIGKGISRRLQEAKATCSVIDIDPKALEYAARYHIPAHTPMDQKEMIALIAHADCWITCTGIKDLMSNMAFAKALRDSSAILINMGAEDEYGPIFPEDRILNGKKPFNFSLSRPTQMRFLDPVFYAHNLCFKLCCEGKLASGFQSLPPDIDEKILSEWQNHWQEDLSEIAVL